MGEMASGLAHELNQPLSAVFYYIRGCVRRLESGRGNIDQILAAMRRASEQAQRAARIVAQMRAFVRKGEMRIVPCDVNSVVTETAGLAEPETKRHSLTVQLDLAPGLPLVRADRTQLQQVILNLVTNAIEAVHGLPPDRRRLVITTRQAGGCLTVAVRDTGRGLAPEIAGQVFDPFFTTRPDGLGMGLSISRSIIEAHGGRIELAPGPGPGTTFVLSLPVQGRADDD